MRVLSLIKKFLKAIVKLTTKKFRDLLAYRDDDDDDDDDVICMTL